MRVEDPDEEPRSFSMEWEGPVDPLLQQGMWTLETREGDQIAPFIVPLGPSSAKADRMTYQAVLTRTVDATP